MTTATVVEIDASVINQDDGVDYRQQHPLQIAMCLRGLIARHEPLSVAFEDRQMVVQILEVDSRNATFIFTFGNVDADNVTLLEADALAFTNLPGTIQTRFVTYGAKRVRFDDRPAFEASFPSVLYHVQRRQHFRVRTPVVDPFLALGVDDGGKRFRFDIQDMSLGGIALRTTESHYADMPLRTVLHDVELQLGHFGTLKIDLEVMSPRQLANAIGDPIHVIGCRFVERSGVAERLLQRVIMQLECKR